MKTLMILAGVVLGLSGCVAPPSWWFEKKENPPAIGDQGEMRQPTLFVEGEDGHYRSYEFGHWPPGYEEYEPGSRECERP